MKEKRPAGLMRFDFKPAGHVYVCTCIRFYFNSDVQFGQRFALIEIALKQYGQSFVVGSVTRTGFFSLLTDLMIRKITKATMVKSITVLRNTP